jgi:hypothetical protein
MVERPGPSENAGKNGSSGYVSSDPNSKLNFKFFKN